MILFGGLTLSGATGPAESRVDDWVTDGTAKVQHSYVCGASPQDFQRTPCGSSTVFAVSRPLNTVVLMALRRSPSPMQA